MRKTINRSLCLLPGAVAALMVHGASAQMFQKATAYENARIVLPDRVIENGTLLVRGDRITAVREGDSADPAGGRGRITRIDCAGSTITAGLIDIVDLWPNTASGGSNASLRAIGAFDHYAERPIRDLLRHGITAGFLPARGGSGVNGQGAVIRLVRREGGWWGEQLVAEHTLCINMGSGDSPLARLRTADSLRKAMRAAIDYQSALDTYEDDIEEYEKKLKERAEEKSKKEEGEEKADKKEKNGGGGNGKDSDKKPNGDSNGQKKPDDAEGDGKEDKEKDELKKPSEPARNPQAEVILKAIEHEIAVRIVAHRSEDILNAIEIAEEFRLKIVIEGATEAGFVAEQIAEADARVILDYSSSGGATARDLERQLDNVGRALDSADVTWGLGSGRNAGARGRFLLLQAQLAAQSTGRDPIRLITFDAAELLGVGDRVGSLEAGRYADFVIWDGDPLTPGSSVQRVFVGGREVFDAEKEQTE